MKTSLTGIRKKKRPALLECQTYRWFGHSAFDSRPYRSKAEVEKWKKKDPIKRFEDKLSQDKILAEEIKKIKKSVGKKVDKAADFAVKSDYPENDKSEEMERAI